MHCPEDIAIVGFDDFPWAASFRPRLTVAAQPGYLIGQTAASLLFERMRKGPDAPSKNVVLATTLLIRDSCGSKLGTSTQTELSLFS
jgi:LacI family transcriptional regulator